jgi:Immunoglobulin I-set domain
LVAVTDRYTSKLSPLRNRFTFECRLECDTAAPLIEWLKDGLPTSQGTTVFKDGVCRLTIDVATAADSATYSCKATTSAGNAETMATLKVKGLLTMEVEFFISELSREMCTDNAHFYALQSAVEELKAATHIGML